MRLGVFLPNWIGDAVMATPALRALRKHVGGGGQLVGVMRPYVADVVDGLDWFDEVVLYDKQPRGGRPPVLDQGLLIEKLRTERLDRVVLLTNSFRTAWLAWRSGVPRRIGYVGQLRGWLLTDRHVKPRDARTGRLQPTLDSYLCLAAAIGCPPEPPRMELATSKADELAADAVWDRLGLRRGEGVVVLNSGGAFGVAKNWPAEHFAALARRIVRNRDLGVLVNSGPSERNIAREIAVCADDPRVATLADIDDLPIGLTKAVIRRSRLLVTTDSGPRFFGIAFGKPVVTLFGPTSPAATQAHYDRETCLSLSLDCQPCMERTCPLGHHRCMRELSVDKVYAAVERHLTIDGAQHGVKPRPAVAGIGDRTDRDQRSRLYGQ